MKYNKIIRKLKDKNWKSTESGYYRIINRLSKHKTTRNYKKIVKLWKVKYEDRKKEMNRYHDEYVPIGDASNWYK